MAKTWKVCRRCSRVGHRGFVALIDDGWRCAAEAACEGRRARRRTKGLEDYWGDDG